MTRSRNSRQGSYSRGFPRDQVRDHKSFRARQRGSTSWNQHLLAIEDDYYDTDYSDGYSSDVELMVLEFADNAKAYDRPSDLLARHSAREQASECNDGPLMPDRAVVELSSVHGPSDLSCTQEDVASEGWSVVSCTESSPSSAWEEVFPLGDGDLSSLSPMSQHHEDEVLARSLQQIELEECLQQSKAPVTSGSKIRHNQLDLPVVERLQNKYGACIVCSQSVATVLCEPCGHLALCASCAQAWNDADEFSCFRCVVCRTPSRQIHIFGGDDSHGSTLNISKGLIHRPKNDPLPPTLQNSNMKLQFKKKKRKAREEKAINKAQYAARYYQYHDMCEEQNENRWRAYQDALRNWKLKKDQARQWRKASANERAQWTCRNQRGGPYSFMGVYYPSRLSVRPSIWSWYRPDIPSVQHEGRQMTREDVKHQYLTRKTHTECGNVHMIRKEYLCLKADRKSEMIFYRQEVKRNQEQAQIFLKKAVEASLLSDKCHTCLEEEACMLSLTCQHMVQCRKCWERSDSQRQCTVCLQSCKAALCVFKP